MPTLAQTIELLLSGGGYFDRIRSISPSNQIAFYKGNEASGTAIVDSSGEANNGVYTGVDLQNADGPVGWKVPYWDGANDVGNIYSAAFNTDFSGAKGALAGWFKVSAAGDWTDATIRYLFILYTGTNLIRVFKNTTNNQMIATYICGGVTKTITKSSYSPTTWIPFVVNWEDSANGDRFQWFMSGTQEGTDQTGFGAWSGALGSTTTCLGAGATTPSNVWKGHLMPFVIWKNYNLTAADIALWSTP